MNHNDKKKVIEKLVIVPSNNKRSFWAKEMKCFNEVYKLYPNNPFWLKVKFPDKFESINLLRSGYYSKELKNKYLRFFYKIPKKESVTLSDDYIKPAELEIYKKPQTLRDFLK